MPSLVDDFLLGKDKFTNFLEVIEECGIKTDVEFAHFMAVTKEHCIDKGITDYDEVKKIWEKHKKSIEKIVKNSIKFPEYNDGLLEEFDRQFFEDDDDDVGYWREDTVVTNDLEGCDSDMVNTNSSDCITIGDRSQQKTTKAFELIKSFANIANMNSDLSVICVQVPEKDYNMLYITTKDIKKE